MNLSVNGQSKVPPGFRFHPTEEELLHYYLRKKVASEKIDLDVIRELDLNKLEPWDIQEICNIGSTPQNDWYFFSHKDKKYPTGTRTNRATAAGFWKATGRDKAIHGTGRRIGMRKTLVFYRGRAPHGQKSDWIMHEYRLDEEYHDSSTITPTRVSNIYGDSSMLPLSSGPEEGWVVCRVFKKKNYEKTTTSSSPLNSSAANQDGILNQILTYMGAPSTSPPEDFKQETISNDDLQQVNPTADNQTTHLPCLELHSPATDTLQSSTARPEGPNSKIGPPSSADWVAMDRLVASQLDGQTSKQFTSLMMNDEFLPFSVDYEEGQFLNCEMILGAENDFWSFAQSSSSTSSDPMGRLSV